MTEHTPMSSVSRLEVITTGARRRWTLEEKRRIVAERYRAPRIVSATARRHGKHPDTSKNPFPRQLGCNDFNGLVPAGMPVLEVFRGVRMPTEAAHVHATMTLPFLFGPC